MWVGIVSIFPEMFQAISAYGITRRAIEAGSLQLEFWNPRDYAEDKHRTVDDRPYGGGPGMLMKVQPLRNAIQQAKKSGRPDAKVICLSPQGRTVDQGLLRDLLEREKMVLVAGRYEGIDERILQTEVDEECSIGDYVVTGGELPAMVLIDAMVRLIPGVLGHSESARLDSFWNGLLDYPQYTRPERIDGLTVPAVLLSGDHQAIKQWRLKQSLGRTWQRRPELIEQLQLDNEQRQLLDEFIREVTASNKGEGND
ncbi:MAG: tRNA (guanosine(37)-N1)-methyltransferase TrmD [Pseudomonadales bacterium]|nr:tRNA (guanosine(37)-N1)-methyltransferase TrmD [Pseudomonadales bacterium]MDP7597407.1 tRNA (guanosine(37)-N1)-methyltransferase TrmD [Pseudomonadales bacterium]HJN53104.1 tRNA (guanosine(37)-N1)-methyltransferase TrmD [Pseudomonadales bacterium]